MTRLRFAGLAALGLAPLLTFAATKTAGPPRVNVPAVDAGVQSLPARKAAQIASLKDLEVFHGFRFTDQVKESGITFVHRAVCDAGKYYKAAHYDHGNGIAAADVDGDGLVDLYFVNQVGGNE